MSMTGGWFRVDAGEPKDCPGGMCICQEQHAEERLRIKLSRDDTC